MEKREIPYKFAEYEGELFDKIKGVFRIKDGERPSPTFGSCMYPWNDYCNKNGIGRTRCVTTSRRWIKNEK